MRNQKQYLWWDVVLRDKAGEEAEGGGVSGEEGRGGV